MGLLSLRGSTREASVFRGDAPRLAAMAALEALFTAVLAWLWYKESMDKKVWVAVLLLVSGGMLLVLDGAQASAAQLVGLLAGGLATAAWGVDNTLARGVADRDPSQVVAIKALLGCCATGLIAWLSGEVLPTLSTALAMFAIGCTGYGLSLRLCLLA